MESHPHETENPPVDKRATFEAEIATGKYTVQARDLIDGIQNIYIHGSDRGRSTGWVHLDDLYTVKPGEMCIVTGVPSHGKSAFLDCLMMNLSQIHGWKFSLFSPENKPYEVHLRKLMELHAGEALRRERDNTRMTTAKMSAAIAHITKHFQWVNLPAPDLPDIMAVWTRHILDDGCTGCVLDPWNEVEHMRNGKMTETEYISLCLSVLREFARKFKVALWVVAHPAKLQRAKDGTYPVPSLWDISGSAHWRAKADVGIVVHRKDITVHNLDIHVQKVRFKTTGKPGEVRMQYHYDSGRMS